MLKIIVVFVTSIALSTLLLGCSDRCNDLARPPLQPVGYGSVSFTVNWPEGESTSRMIPSSVVVIEVTVTQNGQQVGNLTIIRPASTGTIKHIPAGAAFVSATAKDAGGMTVASGATAVTVVAGQIVAVRLILEEGGITLISPSEDPTKPGSIGGTVLTLSPGPTKPEGIIDMAYGTTITLTGTPDAGGTYTDTATSVIRGGYHFDDVPPGIYTLRGTVQAPYGSPIFLTGEVTGVRVRGNIPTLMANVMLFNEARGARVRGTVRKDGQPIGGAVISVELRGYPVDYLQVPASEVYCILSAPASSAPGTLGQFELHLPVDGTRYFVSAHTTDSYASDIELLKVNREQILDFNGSVTGGTFTLSIAGSVGGTFTTSALAYDISNANLKTAIDDLLTSAGYTDVTVTIGGGPCPTDTRVTFGGPAGSWNMPLMAANSSLTGTAQTITVKGTILFPGEVREDQDIMLASGGTSVFPALTLDIVCSTLPAPTPLASEQAMITRLAVARQFRASRHLIDRLEMLARKSRTARSRATGLIENFLYWQTYDDVSTIHGFHVYRGQQAFGDFLYLGSAQDPYQWYFFDNDPTLPLDAPRYYTVSSYSPDAQVSQPTKPVALAQPLPQINVISPEDNTTLPGAGNAQFNWEAVPSAESYVLIIYPTKPTYNAAVYFKQIYPASTNTASVWLNAGTEYWWSVSAYNNTEPNYSTAVSYAAYRKVIVP